MYTREKIEIIYDIIHVKWLWIKHIKSKMRDLESKHAPKYPIHPKSLKHSR